MALALPAACVNACGGSRLIHPNRTKAKKTNIAPITALVSQWLTTSMMTVDSAAPTKVNITTMPSP